MDGGEGVRNRGRRGKDTIRTLLFTPVHNNQTINNQQLTINP